MKVCLFHYGQSLFRKLASLGLKDAYCNSDDNSLKLWFKSFFFLVLSPLETVDTQLDILMLEMTTNLSKKTFNRR
jgi:hypothetical protein